MTYTITFADLQAQPLAVVDLEVDGLQALQQLLGPAFEEAAAAAAQQGLTLAGPPVAHYLPSTAGPWRVAAGFPVTDVVRRDGRVRSATGPSGRVVITTHTGPYDGLADAYDAVRDHALEDGYECDPGWWERYLDAGAAQPRTELLVGCRPVRPHGAHDRRA
jgi:hypothetical protein